VYFSPLQLTAQLVLVCIFISTQIAAQTWFFPVESNTPKRQYENQSRSTYQIVSINRQTKLRFDQPILNIFSSDDLLCIQNEKGLWGVCDTNLQVVIPFEFEELDIFYNGLAKARKREGQFGLIDKRGNWKLPPEYQIIENLFTYGFKVSKDGQVFYLYDSTGKLISIPGDFYINDQAVIFQRKSVLKCEIINDFDYRFSTNNFKLLEQILAGKNDWAADTGLKDTNMAMMPGMAMITDSIYYGMCDFNGKVLIPAIYQDIMSFIPADKNHKILAFAKKNEKWLAIDKNGNPLSNKKYDRLEKLGFIKTSFFQVTSKELIGLIDADGNEITPLQYQKIGYDFVDNRLAVMRDDKYGFIDKTGKEVIPVRYDNVTDFSEGKAWVQLNNRWGLIDSNDKELLPFNYENQAGVGVVNGYSLVRKSGKSGLIDITGKEIIPPVYDQLVITNKLSPNQEPIFWAIVEGKKIALWYHRRMIAEKEAFEVSFCQAGALLKANNNKLLLFWETDGKITDLEAYQAYIPLIKTGLFTQTPSRLTFNYAPGAKFELPSSIYSFSIGHLPGVYVGLNSLQLSFMAPVCISDKYFDKGLMQIPVINRWLGGDMTFDNRFFPAVRKSDRSNILFDLKGNVLVENYTDVKPLGDHFFAANVKEINQKLVQLPPTPGIEFQLINDKNQIITTAPLSNIIPITHRLFLTRSRNEKVARLYNEKALLPGEIPNAAGIISVDTINTNLLIVRYDDPKPRAGIWDIINGKWHISPDQFAFIDLNRFNDSLLYYSLNNNRNSRGYLLMGVMNFQGKIILPDEYERIILTPKRNWLLQTPYAHFLADADGKPLHPTHYYIDQSQADSSLIFIFINGIDKKQGLIDYKGNQLLAPTFEKIHFVGPNRITALKNERWGLYDFSGKNNYLKPIYKDIGLTADNLLYANNDDCRTLYFDLDGQPKYTQYDEVSLDVSEGFRAVRKGKFWGFIDVTGKEIVNTKYLEVTCFYNGMAAVRTVNGWGLVDRNGKLILPDKYTSILHVAEYEVLQLEKAAIVVTEEGKSGVVDSTGKWIISPDYDEVQPAGSYWVAVIRKGNKLGLMLYDTTAKKWQVLPAQFQKLVLSVLPRGFDEQGHQFIIDSKLQLSPTSFEYLSPGHFEFTIGNVVRQGKKYGAVDINNNILLPPIYDLVLSHDIGCWLITQSGKIGVAAADGKVMLPPDYQWIIPMSDTVFATAITRQ
jgi:hypothetical protein